MGWDGMGVGEFFAWCLAIFHTEWEGEGGKNYIQQMCEAIWIW